MRSLRFFVAVFFLAAVSAAAGAQRLIPGQWALSLGGEFSPAPSCLAGGEVSFDKVGYGGRMICRLVMTSVRRDYDSAQSEDPVDTRNHDIYASWGRLWDLCHNRSRSANLWGGVTVDAGARVRKCLWDSGAGLVPGTGFLYGFSPELCFEAFPSPALSVSLFFRPRLQFYARGKDYADDGAERCFYPLIGLRLGFYMFVGK